MRYRPHVDSLVLVLQADEYYCTGYRVAEDILGQPASAQADGYIGMAVKTGLTGIT